MASDMMTVEELADYLRVDPQTIYRKFRGGELPGVKIGRAIRFKREVIDGWLRAASYRWGAERRGELRQWAGQFARERGISDAGVKEAVSARRRRAR